MKKDIADKWIAALRSGEYKQGIGKLHTENGMCCLGVLSHLAEKEGVCKSIPMPLRVNDAFEGEVNIIASYAYDGKYDTLPRTVLDWSGLKTANAWLDDNTGLAKLNDEGKTFAEIADIIEANWEQL